MSFCTRRDARAQARRWLPTLENLEVRCCPAHAGIHLGGGTLVISGDDKANTILVTGDGTGAVTVTLDTGTPQTFTGVKHLDIHSGKGNDSVTLTYATGVTQPHLNVDLHTEDGDDVVNATFGAITNSHLDFNAHLGKGNDAFNLGMNGAVTGKSDAHFTADGEKGDESFTVNATGADVASTAKLSFDLNGHEGTQTTTVNYAGKVNGELRLETHADKGADTVAANLSLATGSTGRVKAHVHGGKDNDNLTLNVNLSTPTDTVAVDALLDGGKGFDTCHATSNVVVKNCEA